jgi:hypothetical protein
MYLLSIFSYGFALFLNYGRFSFMIIEKITAKEKSWYESVLYPVQDAVLAKLHTEKMYLTGGTCLSRFFYHHRYSDDLDFFFLGGQNDLPEFEIECARIFSSVALLGQIDVTVNEKTFKRSFIRIDQVALKIEFIYEPFPTIGNPSRMNNFLIDNRLNIAVNKITAVYSRKTPKDYFDLFFLLRDYSLSELLLGAEKKMIPPRFEELILALEGSFWEGRVKTALDITETEFVYFAKSLIKQLLDYGQQIR